MPRSPRDPYANIPIPRGLEAKLRKLDEEHAVAAIFATMPDISEPQKPLRTGEKQIKDGRSRNALPEEHRFKPGQSGNPGGRPRFSFAKMLRDLLEADDQKFAKAIAMALLQRACNGNRFALKELLDRTEDRSQANKDEEEPAKVAPPHPESDSPPRP